VVIGEPSFGTYSTDPVVAEQDASVIATCQCTELSTQWDSVTVIVSLEVIGIWKEIPLLEVKNHLAIK